MKNIINFIKYNNAFTFIVGLLFIATASTFAASPELRKEAIEAIISQKQTVLSLDNTKLLAQDFGKFDFKLQIKEIKEDSENYYVKYGFRTFVIRDYIWQEDDVEKTLSVSKSFLANRDLGLYTAQELGEVVDYNLSYLKEAQEIEKKKGETNKVVAIEYGGLIGKFLDSKEKEFSGYQPVVEEKKIPASLSENYSINVTTNQTPSAITPQSATAADVVVPDVVVPDVVVPDKEMIRQMVQEAVREILENKTNAAGSSSSSSSEAVLSSNSSSSIASSSSFSSSSSNAASEVASSSVSSMETETSSSSSAAANSVSSESSSSQSSVDSEGSSQSSQAESSSEASSSSVSSESAI